MTAVRGATEFVGVLSDTHGLMRPEALDALRGASHILHAGDVGSPAVLAALREIAPVTAVRGNVDRSPPLSGLPLWQASDLAGQSWLLIHRREDLDLDPRVFGTGVVVFGHTHRFETWQQDGILWLNPGSAGPRRFGMTPGLVRVWRVGESLIPEPVELGSEG
ncbi:MAG TPA: metallophosphoesterase family protein [Myxococcota bacterium]|nr:metallophosphoesterase family protein [Myxococcota bacterium]HQK51821.1 metallophosphoesterase family protein [Myxococcota bacterium]